MQLPTKKAVDQYLKYHGTQCPFCGLDALETVSDFQSDANTAWQDIHCPDCGKQWRDEYLLNNISIMTVDKDNRASRWYSDETISVKDMYIHEYQDVIDQHNKKGD